ncbi:PH domain-containing protein, partial [Patescibacteria group bacterium]
FLNLSEGEFVMLNIRRHPIGLLIPIFATAFVLIILVTLLMLVPDFYRTINTNDALVNLPGADMTVGILMILIVLAGLVGSAAVWIYLKNQFFLTNESVVQYVQYGLFSHREQTVSLGSIEDASFRRQGILQHILNYGTMRLSTEGEETTYRFAFVEDPKKQIATVNNAVEAFKNGRPVGTEFLD